MVVHTGALMAKGDDWAVVARAWEQEPFTARLDPNRLVIMA